eukprot:TRINITY_DN2503_c0_g1_i1.p1 TRINITY_DN2503_c0_g1~~TRINITY_DN2503_c0_g1_i1.p1  ORF type:complete len:273 (-),score=46.73 TRINITY_DN2503_c0_g1_i1:193-1011(-)
MEPSADSPEPLRHPYKAFAGAPQHSIDGSSLSPIPKIKSAKTKSAKTSAHGASSNLCTCLFIGLDGCGKSTIINSLCREIFRPMRIEDIIAKHVKMWKPGSVNPFSTKSVSEVTVHSPNGLVYRFIDTPNAFSHRKAWSEWFLNEINSVVFVIDFNDRIRVPLARLLLHEVAQYARPGTHMIIVATRQEQHPTIDSVEGVRTYLETNTLPIASSVVLLTSDRSSLQNDTSSCGELLKWIVTAMKLKATHNDGEHTTKQLGSMPPLPSSGLTW